MAQSIFNGGINDGHSLITLPIITANSNIFNGGVNDGHSFSTIPIAIGNGNIFNGGVNDGHSFSTVPITIGNGNIFNGGINDGYSLYSLNFVLPVITIVPENSDTICTGSPATFIATAVNAGDNPFYEWYRNDLLVGTNNDTLILSNMADDDSVYCKLISSLPNAFPDTVQSNTVVLTVIHLQNWYADMDGDGYGNSLIDLLDCKAPAGYVSNFSDCNDADPAMHASFYFYIDNDGDGYGTGAAVLQCATSNTAPPPGYSTIGCDADDNNAAVISAPVNSFRSRTSGAWQFASTWEQWNGCSWVDAISRPDFTDDIITIKSPHNVSVLSNIIVDQVVVEAGATLSNTSAGVALTVVDGPGDDIIVNGLFVLGYQGISNGAGNIVINGRMLWSTGTANPNLVINPGGILDKTHHNPDENPNETINLINNASITNYGTFNWVAGNISMCGGSIINMPGGIINALEDNSMSSFGIVGSPCGGAFLDNQGTFNKTEGTGYTDIYFGISNSGIININSGEFRLMGGSSQNSGAVNIATGKFFTVDNGANLQLNTGTVIGGAGTFKNAGYGQPSVTVNTTANAPASISNYLMASITNGGGTVLITGGLEWQAGSISANIVLAATAISSKTTLNSIGLLGTITNNGNFNWQEGNMGFNNGTFNNAGVFNINADLTITNNNTNIFNNSGTLNKNAGTGTSLFSIPINNTSVINVNEGTLEVNSGVSTNSGSINIAAGKFFTVSGYPTYFLMNTGTVVNGAGIFYNNGGLLTINCPLATPALISQLQLNGNTGLLNGSGTAVISGGFYWQNGTVATNLVLSEAAISSKTTSNGGTLRNGTLTNSGIFNWVDGNLEADNGIYTNTTTGIINVSSAGYLYSRENSTDRFNNAGIFRRIDG
ncbi:MAG: hypothetical protein ABI741_14950, partial [Ferruginibacter sp.]